VVKRAHPSPTNGLDLTYIGTGTGDAGDQYTGLDRFGRVVEQKWQTEQMTPTVTDDFTYGYDRDSNRLFRNNLVNTAFGELYHANGSSNGYDNLNQLVAFARGTLNANHDTISSPTHSITWSLDAVGNFSSTTTDGGSTVNNSFNKQNEETSAGTANLAFDNNGNTTTDDQGKTLVYDAWNRLVAYKNGGTTLESYSYDPLNRRIVQNPGTATDLYYSSDWQVLEERTGGVSTATIQYVWSPVYVNALVLRDRSTQNNGTLDERLWVQQDANYNVTGLVNANGSVVERDVYDPYGKVTFLTANWGTLSSSAYAWIYLFQGGRFDSTNNLYNFEIRDDSPALGRWTTLDPSFPTATNVNLYLFVDDHPSDVTDPSGLKPTDMTIISIRKPVTGELGSFFWPVKFKLNDESDRDKGGWVLQEVKIYAKDNKKRPVAHPAPFVGNGAHYWEAFRVLPGKDTPLFYGLGPIVLGILRAIIPNAADVRAVDVYSIGPANPGTSGSITFKGKAWYIDCMKRSEIEQDPAWTNNPAIGAGSYPSILLAGMDAQSPTVNAIFAKHKPPDRIGPYYHDIKVVWKAGVKGSVVQWRIPLD
jgi:RHS repeat-associated protein